jgi:hypothetical protein
VRLASVAKILGSFEDACILQVYIGVQSCAICIGSESNTSMSVGFLHLNASRLGGVRTSRIRLLCLDCREELFLRDSPNIAPAW